jgi:hypothetical protein
MHTEFSKFLACIWSVCGSHTNPSRYVIIPEPCTCIPLKCGGCLGVQNTPTYTYGFYLCIIYVFMIYFDRHSSVVVTVPGYCTEMYCVSGEVRTEFIYVM